MSRYKDALCGEKIQRLFCPQRETEVRFDVADNLQAGLLIRQRVEVTLAHGNAFGLSPIGPHRKTVGTVESPQFRVDAEKRLVRVTFGKKVSLREIQAYIEGLRAHPLFDPKFFEIIDIRAVEEFDMDGAQMVTVADHVDPFSDESKRAFVVKNAVQGHMARMHQILRCAKDKISIFHTMAEAEKWIGV